MSDKVKEYNLCIIYDPETGEIKLLKETHNTRYKFEINGEQIECSEEMEEYLDKHVNADILGVA